MSDHTDLMTRLREHAENMYVDFLNHAADALEAQAKRIEELEAAMREIYEVYAGSDGFIPETCAEGYQQQLIKEIAEIAAKHMRHKSP